MPFTFSHPAIILPLSKCKKLSINALIIGSIIPDFEFYFKLKESYNIGHSLSGIVIFDIPFGLLILFLYNKYIRLFIRTILPKEILYKCNTLNYKFISYNKDLINFTNISSLIIGILSHLLLDLFTHNNNAAIQAFPILSKSINLVYTTIPLYTLNQLLFSLFGLIILAICFIKTPITFSTKNEVNKNNLFLFISLASIILCVRLICFSEHNNFWGIVVAIIGSLIYSLIFNSIFYHFLLYNRKNIQKQ